MLAKSFPQKDDQLPIAPVVSAVRSNRVKAIRRDKLDALSLNLLDQLPKGLRLDRAAELYPHIVNRLAVCWDDVTALEGYLNELLYTERPERDGLDFRAAAELSDVRNIRVRLLRGLRPVR
jgi:hypothetical protein